MEFTNITLTSSIIFLVLLLIIGFLGYKNFLKQKKFNKNYRLLSTNNYFYFKYIFLILSFFVILLSIFSPKISKKVSNNSNSGIDIIFVLDVSKSMNVADITDGNYNYTRLDVIKESISKFVVNHIEDRFGLVIFAGDAISTVPLTIDHDIFLTFLENVDYRNLTIQGSDFEKAIELGVNRFDISEDRSKAMIFVSDGGDEDYKVDLNKIKNISKSNNGINYNIVGVGTNNGGRIITGRDHFGRFTYQKYKGQDVISKLNKDNLKDIANTLNGKYIQISEVDDIFKLNEYIDKLEKKSLENGISGEKINAGRILSFISFLFFILFFIFYIFENKFYKLIIRKND